MTYAPLVNPSMRRLEAAFPTLRAATEEAATIASLIAAEFASRTRHHRRLQEWFIAKTIRDQLNHTSLDLALLDTFACPPGSLDRLDLFREAFVKLSSTWFARSVQKT